MLALWSSHHSYLHIVGCVAGHETNPAEHSTLHIMTVSCVFLHVYIVLGCVIVGVPVRIIYE